MIYSACFKEQSYREEVNISILKGYVYIFFLKKKKPKVFFSKHSHILIV